MSNRNERRTEKAKVRTGKISLDFRVQRWLEAPSPWQGKLRDMNASPVDLKMSNKQVLCLLMAKNGFRPKVTGWGKFSGPFGLEPHEAFLLMELMPYFQGLIDGGDLNTHTVVEQHLQPELDRLAELFNAISADEAALEGGAAAAAADPAALQEGGDNSADSVEAAPAEAAAAQ